MITANPLLRGRCCLGKASARPGLQAGEQSSAHHIPREPPGRGPDRRCARLGGTLARLMSWQVGPPILRARLNASLFFTVSYTPAKVSRGECLPVGGRWGWCRGARRKEGLWRDWLEDPAGAQRTGLAPR